jgi:transposase
LLLEKVAQLEARLNKNSSNSSKPPSSDGPGARGVGKNIGDGQRKQGAQKGHPGTSRALLPLEEVDSVVELYPAKCENCWQDLPQTPDASAQRHQVTELPALKPHVTEYRCNTLTCACGFATSANAENIPNTAFGPRLTSLVGLLTGVYNVSRRQTETLLSEVLGVEMSLGSVSALESRLSDSLAKPMEEAWEKVLAADVKQTDATSWLQAGKLKSLWTIASKDATVYKILDNGSAALVRPMLGEPKGILVSDRATVYSYWDMNLRQICWSHLLRKFVEFSERSGAAKTYGAALLDYTGLIFEYWHAFEGENITRAQLQQAMKPVRKNFEALLEKIVKAGLKDVCGSCEDILSHRNALWTFVHVPDVPPTNNHSERELRQFVLWRKRCFGSQSLRGNTFAERIQTAYRTCKKQSKSIFQFLTDCCTAFVNDDEVPSLFPA